MIYKNMKNKGFTLIELLIAVVVIGILAGILLSVLNAGRIRGTARDAQRASDLGRMQAALELYYAQNRQYPTTSSNWANVSVNPNILSGALVPGFMSKFPEDPSSTVTTANPCSCTDSDGDKDCDAGFRYSYRSNGSTYELVSIMEVVESKDPSPCTTAQCSGDILNNCYVVQNP
jgi:prepilin-type N-terminal cleavage/methylation domain-containing protein